MFGLWRNDTYVDGHVGEFSRDLTLGDYVAVDLDEVLEQALLQEQADLPV